MPAPFHLLRYLDRLEACPYPEEFSTRFLLKCPDADVVRLALRKLREVPLHGRNRFHRDGLRVLEILRGGVLDLVAARTGRLFPDQGDLLSGNIFRCTSGNRYRLNRNYHGLRGRLLILCLRVHHFNGIGMQAFCVND